MNIIIKLFDGDRFCFRPDTTWERKNRDFFSPDFMERIFWTPVIFVRICKAGRYVSGKFVERYYDAANFGMLMYDGKVLAENRSDSVAFSSMTDKTSILPSPLYPPQFIWQNADAFTVSIDNDVVYSTDGTTMSDDASMSPFDKGSGIVIGTISQAIVKASERISLRTGDFVAAELAAPTEINLVGKDRICVKGTICKKDSCKNSTFRNDALSNDVFKFDIVNRPGTVTG